MLSLHISEHPLVQPITDGLYRHLEKSVFDIKKVRQDEAAWSMLEMECDAAVVSPVVYARKQKELVMLDGACVAEFGATGDVMLYFKPGLHHISKIITIDMQETDILLTKIVLSEKYRMEPEFIPMETTVMEAIQHADGVLAPGTAPVENGLSQECMDMSDEWFDMVQVPYVRYVMAGWKHRITEELDLIVKEVGKEADEKALKLLDATVHGRLTDDETHQIPAHRRYYHTQDTLEGLETFFRYAFYHGLHKDIP